MPRPDSFIVIALLTVLVALGPVSTDLYLPSLPGLTAALDADVASVQLTLSLFLAGLASGQLLWGPVADRYGRRPVLIVGLSIYCVASVACTIAGSIELLVVGRFVQAFGAAVGPTLCRAIVRDVHGRSGTGRVMSYLSAAVAVAPMIAPIFGGFVEVWFGWRANMAALVLYGSFALLATVLILPETNPAPDATATHVRRMFGNYAMFLRNRLYLGYLFGVAFAYAGIFCFISGSSFVLVDLVGVTPDVYGFCFGAIVIGYIVGSTAGGKLSRRLAPDRLVRIGSFFMLAGAGAILIFALTGDPSVVTIVGPTIVFMIGVGLTMPSAYAGALIPFPRAAGAASSLVGFIQMSFAALVGLGIGHVYDETALPMAGAMALVAGGAALAYWLIVRPAAKREALAPPPI
ncbi:MAG: multidrug effflux MFS transporter [Rhodospirillaceae bacterium]|nr:multidrug effflux MFS transporter [Rhodospirillaceae bacterium]